MKLFTSLYDKTLQWASHKHAVYYLSGMSFAESSFFPVPVDVMLAPMCLAQRQRAWFFAFIATLFSVLGGVLGYIIGAYAFDIIAPVLKDVGYWDKYLSAKDWFDRWGIWVVFLAGFTPIPYKLITISAGVASMALLPFIAMSLIGRGARFFLVAGLIRWGGERMGSLLREYIEKMGWTLIGLASVFYVAYQML